MYVQVRSYKLLLAVEYLREYYVFDYTKKNLHLLKLDNKINVWLRRKMAKS